MDSQGQTEAVLKRIAQWCFFIVTGISAVSLAGWVTGLLILVRVKPEYIPIAPSTAACFAMLSVSLSICTRRPEITSLRTLAAAAAGLTASICLITLVQLPAGALIEWGRPVIEAPSRHVPVPIGQMSPITAITFLLTTGAVVSLLLSRQGKQLYKDAAAYGAAVVVLIGFVVILGYFYGTPLLYGGNIVPVALPTAVAFELMGFGLIAASGPDVLLVKVFTGPTVHSRLMRAFLPPTVGFVMFAELLYRITFTRAANPALIASLIALVSLVILSMLIANIAKSIGSEIDLARGERLKAEEKLRLDEDRLETLLKLALLEVDEERVLTDFALEEGVRLTRSSGGYLHFFNEDQQTIQLNSWSRGVLKTCTASQDHHYPLAAAGVWADSIRFRRPVIHNDYQALPDKKGYPEGHFHLMRHLGVPVIDGGRIVGVAGVGNKEEPYDESDARQISLFMHTLWVILKQRRIEAERESLINELRGALKKIKTLSGMLPICASCKKIRDDKGYWNQIEVYISQHSGTQFSHGICPECVKKLYPEISGEISEGEDEKA